MTTFLQFLKFIEVDLCDVDHVVIIAFMEFLAENSLKHSSIANYVCSLKAAFKFFGLNDQVLQHHFVSLALRNMARNIPVPLKANGSIQHSHTSRLTRKDNRGSGSGGRDSNGG